MADRVAAELEHHSQRTRYQADDLVFGHPDTGNPYDASKLRRRFKAAVKRAGVREVRFHDLRHTFGTAFPGARPSTKPAANRAVERAAGLAAFPAHPRRGGPCNDTSGKRR